MELTRREFLTLSAFVGGTALFLKATDILAALDSEGAISIRWPSRTK